MAIRSVDNEPELLQRVSRGDTHAFTELFQAYHQDLGKHIYHFTRSIDVTQDIVQDVFIKVWLQRSELIRIGNFSGWLYILARNHALNMLTKRVNMLRRDSSWQNQFDQLTDPVAGNAGDEYRLRLEQAVDRLPPQQQKAYRLHRQERLTYAQVAEKLGVAPSTVKRNVEEAIRNLKKQLDGSIDPVVILILLTPFFHETIF